jgi:hypothetical protein
MENNGVIIGGLVGGLVGLALIAWTARGSEFRSINKVRPNWRFRVVAVLMIVVSICFVGVGGLSVMKGNYGGMLGIFIGFWGCVYFAYKAFFHFIIIKSDSFIERRLLFEVEIPYSAVRSVEYLGNHDLYKIHIDGDKDVFLERSMLGAERFAESLK